MTGKKKPAAGMDNYISEATARNWEKLHTRTGDRLAARANKRRSRKRVLPLEYISHKDNIPILTDLVRDIDESGLDIMSVLLILGIRLLREAGLYGKDHVTAVIEDYEDLLVEEDQDFCQDLSARELPRDERDLLGLVYQSFLQEGTKNIRGSYYTPSHMVRNMTRDLDFSQGQTFLDPCCGSGAYLLSVPNCHPCQLFGLDKDPAAVLISRINLLLAYREVEFTPRIYCLDYLETDFSGTACPFYGQTYDYIVTNPPWGAVDEGYKCGKADPIRSNETFSHFFVKAYSQLKEGGRIRFLFPRAILNVKIHRDIRRFMVETARLVSITSYKDMFSGVTTETIDIECSRDREKPAGSGTFIFREGDQERKVDLSTVFETKNLIINLLSGKDMAVIRKVRNLGRYSLEGSLWALGVVTGDNKRKLFKEKKKGMEAIYTGKEICPYVLKPPVHYLYYDRNQFQQVGREEIYRAPEKLVYKFISTKPVFAYDDQASLFLNSANILIPAVPGMSVKTVMVFLNSALFQFMYRKLFGEVKILKGNLMELLFPEIPPKENMILTALAEDILLGDVSKQEEAENHIFDLYGLSQKEIDYVKKSLE